MINKIDIGGFYLDEKKQRIQLPIIKKPTLKGIINNYLCFCKFEGVLCIDKVISDKLTGCLEIYFKNKITLPMIKVDDGDDFLFYTLTNDLINNKGFEYFMGEPFPRAVTIDDEAILIQAIEEFIHDDNNLVPKGFLLEV